MSEGPLRVRVLGPLRVLDASGADVTPDGLLQRRLLSLLVLRRGQVVSVDAAVDALWPGRPPRDPAAALQNHVFRLRRRLRASAIDSVGDGYRLSTTSITVDADQLIGLLNSDAADTASADALDLILDEWQGPAHPELSDVDDGRAESLRLDELRVRAREARAERRLASGDLAGLIPELGALVEDEPLRERPRSLLMAALSADGRRAEALRVFDDFRRLLGDELGIEPSPLLVAQHAGLLDSDSGAWRSVIRPPTPPTSIIGREALVGEIVTAVDAHRLVTLVGPGGVGKTRVAVEVGERLLDSRSDRPVVWCELALGAGEGAVEVVAAALSIDLRPGTTATDRITSVLGDSEVVVVLDNCEHVLEPIARLSSQILAACPHVHLVATSRERLRLPGEQVRTVPPLTVDDDASLPVALFVDRARAVAPGFAPEPSERVQIVEIVRRLDGLPLAIELAAARLHVHGLDEIVAGLDSRFRLLSSGYRSSSRHGSLRAVVDWSFGLLDPPLQRTFVDLSVFVGAFSPADASAITGADLTTSTEHLIELAERSLIARGGDGRYLLLETLRAFAAGELDRSGRADEVHEQHAQWCLSRVETAEAALHEPGSTFLADLDPTVPELQAALDWLVDHQRVELAGRLVSALIHPMVLRLRPDVLAWSDRVLALDPQDRGACASQLWAASAYAAWMAGDLVASAARSARAVAAGDRRPEGLTQLAATTSGNCDLFDGRLDEAVIWYQRGIEAAENPTQRFIAAGAELLAAGYAGDARASSLADELLIEVGDDPTPVAAYVWYCAGEAVLQTDVDLALARLTRAVEMAHATNASFVLGIAGASKASIDARTGDPAAAAADYRWLIPHWQRAGMWSTQWTMLRSIIGLLTRLGRHRDAAVLEGALRSTTSGHRVFGADEVALRQIGDQLRSVLGEDAYRQALADGARLDGDAAVAHALRVL